MLRDDKYMFDSAQSMIKQSETVKKLCCVLFSRFKIDYYEYQQVNPNGEMLFLVSDDNVYTDFIDFSVIGYEALNLDFSTYKKIGYYACDFMDIKRPDLQTYVNILENYGYGHIFKIKEIVYDTLIPLVVMHTFATKITDNQLFNQYYLENIRTLKTFTKYFRAQLGTFEHKIKHFKTTVNVAEKSKVIRKFKTIVSRNEQEAHDKNGGGNDNTPTADLLSLSKRQREIIHWYIKGKNAAETAELLSLSKRTVENHFYRLEKRYACSSKIQLLVKFLQDELIDL